MTTYSKTNFNFKTTKTSTGIILPLKFSEGCDINLWSFFTDEINELLRYLREDFVVRDTDVFICTYPRSGTHWTHEIVNMLLQKSTEFAPLSTFVECLLPKEVEEMEHPRIICTHLQLEHLPPKILETAKVIFTCRNPKDVAVSLHNLNRQLNFVDYEASFGDYLSLFLSGEVPTGSWFDHVRGWERSVEANKSKILAITYEDMKENHLENVKKIAAFLGINLSPELIEEIRQKCEFKVIHKEKTTNVPELVSRLSRDTPSFLYRKGEVGDWKNWFTVAQNEEFDRVYAEKMKGSTLNIKFTLK